MRQLVDHKIAWCGGWFFVVGDSTFWVLPYCFETVSWATGRDLTCKKPTPVIPRGFFGRLAVQSELSEATAQTRTGQANTVCSTVQRVILWSVFLLLLVCICCCISDHACMSDCVCMCVCMYVCMYVHVYHLHSWCLTFLRRHWRIVHFRDAIFFVNLQIEILCSECAS